MESHAVEKLLVVSSLVKSCADLLLAPLLIHGARKSKRMALVPWLAWSSIGVIWEGGMIVAFAIHPKYLSIVIHPESMSTHQQSHQNLHASFLIVTSLFAAIEVYFILVVYSHYQILRLEEDGGMRPVQLTNMATTAAALATTSPTNINSSRNSSININSLIF
ncbi:unnamed protein product [Darwinula stevensoni]|uniref:Uncharacterized protein n=1 Tax=Darwinula stevensoni TaxID=69355 RepID=A0A7R8X1J1_9CRUS|nr:unnamed protein product [Darwinula stevensoni]CAG0882866.1 unnamed protein product [Darwinula stevensoni]